MRFTVFLMFIILIINGTSWTVLFVCQLEISALNDFFFNPSKIVVYDGTGEIRNDVDSPVAQYYSVPFSFLDIFFGKPTQSLYRIDQSLY